jgi:hypothetical protein
MLIYFHNLTSHIFATSIMEIVWNGEVWIGSKHNHSYHNLFMILSLDWEKFR